MFALMEHLALYTVLYSFSDTLILSSDHKIFVTPHVSFGRDLKPSFGTLETSLTRASEGCYAVKADTLI